MANIMDLFRANRQRGITLSRLERIKREGSPPYVYEAGVIAATASEAFNVGQYFTAARKYQPLDWLEVVNNETTIDVLITINSGDAWLVPAKSIRTIDNTALWHISITNRHAANSTTAGMIRLTLQKQPLTIDKWIRGQQ